MRDGLILTDKDGTILVNQRSYSELIKWLIVEYVGVSYQKASTCVEQHIPFFESICTPISAALEGHDWPYYYTAMRMYFGDFFYAEHAKLLHPPPNTPEGMELYERLEADILRKYNLNEPILWESKSSERVHVFMRTPVFTGACPALATPFDQQGNINYDAFGRLIDAQIEAGVDAVCVCGTTGESATMSIREHIAAVEFCVKRVDHRVKVIAGAGSNDTSAAVYLSQHAQDSGADALLHVTPYYNKASQTGLIRHYEYIADRTDLPIILYNVPSRTGVSFTAETYKILAENPKINGVKEASGNFSLLAHTRHLCPDDFYIWSGNDDQVVPMMALGAKGVISVVSNIAPEVMVKMSHLCLDNDFAAASQLQIQYMDLIDALFCEVNPIPVKTAMNLMGMEAGPLRLPLCEMSEKNLAVLRASMERMGLL